MSALAWFHSADAMNSATFWITLTGGLLELGVAALAIWDLRRDLPEEKEERVERYIACFAAIAATCAFASILTSHRAAKLEQDEQNTTALTHSNAMHSATSRLAAVESGQADRGITPQQSNAMVRILSAGPKGPIKMSSSDGREPLQFARQIESVMTGSGFTNSGWFISIADGVPGAISLSVQDTNAMPPHIVPVFKALLELDKTVKVWQIPRQRNTNHPVSTLVTIRVHEKR